MLEVGVPENLRGTFSDAIFSISLLQVFLKGILFGISFIGGTRQIISCAQLDNPEVPWFPAVILLLSKNFTTCDKQKSMNGKPPG